jgi:ABC transporter
MHLRHPDHLRQLTCARPFNAVEGEGADKGRERALSNRATALIIPLVNAIAWLQEASSLCDGLLRWLLQLIVLRVRSREFKELEVSAGEMVIVTGPSGSGKTTLLCVMGCILHPASGAVAIFNQNVVGLRRPELTTLKIDVVAPMPRPRTRIALELNPICLRSLHVAASGSRPNPWIQPERSYPPWSVLS